MANYLLDASLIYEFPILRPVQQVLRDRGDQVAWFFDNDYVAQFARPDERVLVTVQEVMEFNPVAVFKAGVTTYDFFPGVKVQLFHGLTISKRADSGKEDFRIRGLFDLYCTHGPTDTPRFQELSKKLGHFKVAETGWPKFDNYFPGGHNASHVLQPGERPTVLYSSTFTRSITSTPYLYDQIERLIQKDEWDWIITLHPKSDPEIIERYRTLERYKNVTFYMGDDNTGILKRADVMVCDSSAIIIEFMSMGKPVVTFRNTQPGSQLIDIDDPALLEESIREALTRPEALMRNIREYVDTMNPHLDGLCSLRVVEATDRFIEEDWGRQLRCKPLNLVRRWQLRRKLNYFPCIEKLRRRIL